MPWYPSAKACPAAIKPTVQCFFPTLYQVLLFNFSSFGEKLFFCLRGYAAQSREARCKNSRSDERGCSSVPPPPNRRRMGGGSNLALPPTGYRRAIAQSEVQKQPERRARMFLCSPAAGGTWRGDRMFLCSPAAEQAANGWRQQPGPTANKLSPRCAKLALNVRIGCSCRAHNHHKFSHRILQPHTKRRASHAD